MSYEMQKKNRDEEKVFSVLMSEEEVALFSEFLEQREFGRFSDRLDELNEAYEERERVWGDKEKTNDFFNRHNYFVGGESEDEAVQNMKNGYKELKGHHRLARKYIKRVDPELQKLKKRHDENETFGSTVDLMAGANKALTGLGNIYQTEEKLKRTKYDDRYSAKGIERLVGRKIDAEEAKNIVNNRSKLSDSYKRKDGVILKSEGEE